MNFQETKRVLFLADLAGYARATASLDALGVARFLDDWYRDCAGAVTSRAGRVVKFIGDACLAIFPEDHCVNAVDAALSLSDSLLAVQKRHALKQKVELAVNIHVALVAEGLFGTDDDRRFDVLGSGVNHLFMMGGSAGLRVSEPAYRQLPNERRDAWTKVKPPAIYTLLR